MSDLYKTEMIGFCLIVSKLPFNYSIKFLPKSLFFNFYLLITLTNQISW